MKKIDYDDAKMSVVTYIDVLGYKDIIGDDKKARELLSSFIETYNELERIIGKLGHKVLPLIPEVKYNTVSDSIVIAMECFNKPIIDNDNKVNLTNILTSLVFAAKVQFNLLKKGFLCKGAITLGKYICNEQMVFGSGLSNAYQMEKENHYPRVVVDENIIELLFFAHDQLHHSMTGEQFGMFLRTDEIDQKTYVNYIAGDTFLDYICDGELNDYGLITLTDASNGLKNAISYFLRSHANGTVDEITVKKYMWAINYQNEMNESGDDSLNITEDVVRNVQNKTIPP